MPGTASSTSEMVATISALSSVCAGALPCPQLSRPPSLTSSPFPPSLSFPPTQYSGDVALVRMYRELSRRIVDEAETSPLKCTAVPWGGAWEVEKWLLEN